MLEYLVPYFVTNIVNCDASLIIRQKRMTLHLFISISHSDIFHIIESTSQAYAEMHIVVKRKRSLTINCFNKNGEKKQHLSLFYVSKDKQITLNIFYAMHYHVIILSGI